MATMGAFESNILKRRAQPSGAEKLIAVVSDDKSVDVINNGAVDQSIASSHVTTGSIETAMEIMTSLKESPRHLIVDVTGSTMAISDLTRLASVVDPSVSVIVIGERNDVGLYRSLLRIGVQDYLVKPLTTELVRRALAPNDSDTSGRMGKVLSFVGTRGGVGVTTIATSVASHLADATRRRIAYIDLDPYGGGAASMLGVTPNNGLIELLQNPQRLDQQLINQAFVARSDRLLVLAAEIPYNQEFRLRPRALTELVAMLKHHFHYIVLDLPERAGAGVEEALDASSTIHVVADLSVQSAREAARLCRFAHTLDGAPAISVLLNDAREPVPGRVRREDFADVLGRGSVFSLPYEPQTLALAENLGEADASAGALRSPFAAAIVSLANAITGSQTPVVAPEPWYKRLLAGRRAR
jgi:pilus assembly protein CpaE